jgi:hypothetical protein
MTLADLVRVNTSYTRSVNIERDSVVSDTNRAYVITARARQTLERIILAVRKPKQPRAWALIGPYGSGKSAFGLFLNHLVADVDLEASKNSRRLLREADEALANQFQGLTRGTRGFCCVLLTGSPEPLGQRIVQAMAAAASRFFAKKAGRPQKILKDLREAAKRPGPSVSEVMELLVRLQRSVRQSNGCGLLVVIDELGKFLEYEARHRGGSDIFLLQALAEHSVQDEGAPLVLVALLHQSFELYAQRLGEQLKNEWKKVSGRFESVPFLETAGQTIRVVKAAMTTSLPADIRRRLEVEARQYASALTEVGALPGGLQAREAQGLFAACYPLHPISLLVLPTLCQRVAQNERTLFSYLGSHEPHGFLETLVRLNVGKQGALPWIKPKDIYEYFILNQPALTTDHSTHRRWAEVVTALERVGDVSPIQTDLIKTIGLLNIIGAQGGLKATDRILSMCFDGDGLSTKALQEGIKDLRAKSAITFRKFSSEYRVWQGTDFDLDAAISEHKSQIGRIDIAEVLNGKAVLPPIVARRHAIATGTLRYFTPIFVSQALIGKIFERKSPTIFLCIAETIEEMEAFRARLCALGPAKSLGAIYEGGSLLREAVTDVQALERIQRQSQELANDPVGQRELRDRLAAARQSESELIMGFAEEPQRLEWVIGGAPAQIATKRHLQTRLSDLLSAVYSRAPIIRNELINRDKPSSSAIAGRKKLLLAMLDCPNVADLGIDKFPSEKAMYRSILRATGLHVERGGQWSFSAPPEDGADAAQMRPLWDEVMKLLDNERGEPVAITSIYRVLAAAPYGVKEGVLPILVIALYLALNKEIALCQQGQFVPFMTQEILEGLLKDPEAYTLQRFQLDSVQRALYRVYATVLRGESADNESLVTLLQPLAKMMLSLPDYTKHTQKRLSREAIAVRDLFFAAKTPVQLIFTDLPNACGVTFNAGQDIDRQLALFAEKLRALLIELQVAYHGLLSDFIELVRTTFSLDKSLLLHELRETLRGRCRGLQSLTIDQQGLKAFLGRIGDPFGDDTQWVISVATFLARKPPEKWTDDDVEAAQYRLREFASRLNDLRQLQLHTERGKQQTGEDFEAALIRVISTETGEAEALVTLDKSTRQLVANRATEMQALLDALPSQETKLAALICVLNCVLRRQTGLEDRLPDLEGKVA